MKLQHKYTNKTKGVYMIKNLISNDVYIGSTINTFYNRYRNHISNLKGQKHHSIILQRDVNKYGIDNFTFDILMISKNDNFILEMEDFLIKKLNPKYNVCKEVLHGGKPNLGRKLTKEWKENIRKKSLLYTHDEEVLKLVTSNNKKNGCDLIFKNENTRLEFSSWVEASIYFECSPSTLQNSFIRTNKYKGYSINRKTKQSKSIRLFIDNSYIDFTSLNECDRYLNLWRGATSTALNKGLDSINGYKIKLID